MNSKIINSIKQFVIAVLTIVLALAVGAILVRISGNDPAEAYTTLFRRRCLGGCVFSICVRIR